jgi:hypothetical protein
MNTSSANRTLALICAILLVPALVFALVTTNLQKSLFDPALYKDAFRAARVYDRLPNLIAEQLAAKAGQQGGVSAFLLGALPPDALQKLLASVLPADAVQRLAEQGIDQALAYVNGRSGDPGISLGGIKQQLASNSGGLLDEYFNSLPACSLADALSLAGGLLGGGELPRCNPPDAVKQAISGPLSALLEQQLNEVLPESLGIGGAGTGLQGFFTTLRWMRVAAALTPLLALLLLGVMTLLAVRTAVDLLRWWGWPLLIAGLLSLCAGMLVAPAFTAMMDATLIARLSEAAGPGIAALFSGVASAVAAGLVRPILLDALVVSLLGGLLLILERFSPRETE